jgi:hypothetical protein
MTIITKHELGEQPIRLVVLSKILNLCINLKFALKTNPLPIIIRDFLFYFIFIFLNNITQTFKFTL